MILLNTMNMIWVFFKIFKLMVVKWKQKKITTKVIEINWNLKII